MSEMEYHTGRIERIPQRNETEEELAERICKEYGIEDKYDDGWIEALRDEGYNHGIEVLNVDGDYQIWKLVEHTQFEDGYMFEAEKEADDSVSFIFSFYNGGTCLSEMLEEAVKKVNNGD
jgi:hypothetical protein